MLHADSTTIDRAIREAYNITRTQDSNGKWAVSIQFQDNSMAELYSKRLLDALWNAREHQLDSKISYT